MPKINFLTDGPVAITSIGIAITSILTNREAGLFAVIGNDVLSQSETVQLATVSSGFGPEDWEQEWEEVDIQEQGQRYIVTSSLGPGVYEEQNLSFSFGGFGEMVESTLFEFIWTDVTAIVLDQQSSKLYITRDAAARQELADVSLIQNVAEFEIDSFEGAKQFLDG